MQVKQIRCRERKQICAVARKPCFKIQISSDPEICATSTVRARFPSMTLNRMFHKSFRLAITGLEDLRYLISEII